MEYFELVIYAGIALGLFFLFNKALPLRKSHEFKETQERVVKTI